MTSTIQLILPFFVCVCVCIAPPPPSIQTLSAVSATSILVEWGSISNAIGYEITYSPAQGECVGVPGGTVQLSATNGAGTTSFTLTQLEEFTNYAVVVRSLGAQGAGLQASDPMQERTQQAGTYN